MPVLILKKRRRIKTTSSGLATVPIMRRMKGFAAYLPFRVPLAAAPFVLWNELVINDVQPVAPLLRSLETTLHGLPDDTQLAILALI